MANSKMNFSRAVRGTLTRSGVTREIDSQSEVELGRILSPAEKSSLFQQFGPELVCSRIQKYGFGALKFMKFLSTRPELKCKFSQNATPRDGNCLLHAISDGVLNNDAFKHTAGESANETWTHLLSDLKFFEEMDNHIMYLRRRFVLGAADWMAGNNGSLQNDKLLFNYTDAEWEFIWNTLLEDGAWAVPGIKDAEGNVIKENYGPEILIKFIAHDLRCNIVVFDLYNLNVQFVSGNHLKLNNVVFESPLLLYATGSHFQAVVQQDHEFFVKYAQELEAGNQPQLLPPSSENSNSETASNLKNKTSADAKPKSDANPKNLSNSSAPTTRKQSSGKVLKNKQTKCKTDNMESKTVDEDQIYEMVRNIKARERTEEQQNFFLRLNQKKSRARKKSEGTKEMNAKNKDRMRLKRKNETAEERAERCRKDKEKKSEIQLTETEEQQIERRRKNKKNKTEMRLIETDEQRAERCRKDNENKSKTRLIETDEQRAERCRKDKESKSKMRLIETDEQRAERCRKIKEIRLIETDEQRAERCRKDKENKSEMRLIETEEERAERCQKIKENMKKLRQNETVDQRAERCRKNREHMKQLRSNSSELKRLKKFRESVRYGPIFTCSICEQDMFSNNVSALTEEFKDMVKAKSIELYKNAFEIEHPVEIYRFTEGDKEMTLGHKFYICTTCKKHLKKERLPAMAAANGLKLQTVPKHLQLTELESNLIAKNIIFQKIYQLPKSRMAACKDRLINIPVSSEDVLNTIESLPRTPQEAGLLEVKLKRKLDYKNVHQQAYVDPEKVFKALEFLKETGHPEYQFFDDYTTYKHRCARSKTNMIFVDDTQIESIMEKQDYLKCLQEESADEQPREKTENASDDEEEYITKDVIRKFQYDYDTSVCLVDKYPEAAITEDQPKQLSFAPGEGKRPENILNRTNWDTKAFPMKHPDGKNNLHQERDKKLTDQYYFVQRLRNQDTRFSTDPAYVFAAAGYLEKKQLERNVNVSYQRGKEVRSSTGTSTFHLEDGFSVFDSIKNTPKYWKNAKYEMLAKLDNLGPFQFFFTLSCADKRWEENLSAILRKMEVSIVYQTNSDGKEETLVKLQNGQTMDMEEYLEKRVDASKHELIRRHIFIATRNYNNRVRSFIRDIMTDKNNPMCVQYWTTKVEFQGRGAGHNHGTIWVDLKKMEYTYIDDEGRWIQLDKLLSISEAEKMELKQELKRLLEIYHFQVSLFKEADIDALYRLYSIFQVENAPAVIDEDPQKFFEEFLDRFTLFGLSSAFKKFQTREDLLIHEEKAVIMFANKFTTCTLNEAVIASKTDDEDLKKRAAEVVKIIEECYIHSHTKTCRKYSSECRFGIPRFPMWKTILTRPLKVTGDEEKLLKQKYSNILKKVKDLLNDKDVIKNILDEIPKDLDKTVELYEQNRKKRIKSLLSIVGLKTDDDIKLYEEALTFSTSGYTLILERDLDELYVNSYNPEWARAWNGNTDLQVCLDFFAIITYITEYFTKDDTGMMSKLIEMVKNGECETLQDRMRMLMNTFISARQMGECEAYYKIMPDFHLKDSNVKTVFIPTSKKDLRSKFMIKVDEKMDYNGKEKKKILDREGWFVEKYDLIDKYMRRDRKCTAIDELCPAQYFKMFDTAWKMKTTYVTEDGSDTDDEQEGENDHTSKDNQVEEINKFHYVMRAKNGRRIPLPDNIEIENPYPGEPPFMRKRKNPAVIRFHKPKQDIDPAAYFFSEALLYTPFRTEEELETKVNKAALDGYEALENEIWLVKSQVMEYLESNEEARIMVKEASDKAKEMGDVLDPEGEQDIEDCEREQLLMHPDYAHLDPAELDIEEEKVRHEKTFRPIEVDDMKVLCDKTRNLDFYQKKVVERGVRFARNVVKSLNSKNPPPEPMNVIVLGGAGCGKSHVINVLKQWCHLLLQQPGDDPECPYVIVAAPTGTAASNVRGQTIHSAFGLNFGNEHFSLSDKVRDKRRSLMKNLRFVIIDEYSMVKSDQLFQLDKRLREITQKPSKLFGGVAMFWFGDIMQLKPCKGRYIFHEPINHGFKLDYFLGTHWQSFEVILLEENHRQNEDKPYADMLNRFRVGQQKEEDMQILQTRVRPLKHPDLDGAMFISCKNIEVDRLNRKRLNEIAEQTVKFEATNVHPVIRNFTPPIGNKGNVKDTPFLQTLELKKGARVMLTFNIDTSDCLTNGTRGEVVNFVRNAAGIVEKIMIKFDETHQGQQKRERSPQLSSLFPGCTSVERVMFQYSLARKSKNVSNTAKVIQFPLSLCFAATSHKFQGQTIFKPNKSACDFRTVFQAAQSYVMLSRVQSLSQLFVIGYLPDSKFYASHHALNELERLVSKSINRNPPVWEKEFGWSLKISLLNCHSFSDKFADLEMDQVLLLSDIICLNETWLQTDDIDEGMKLQGYKLTLNSAGHGKGVATYYKSEKASHGIDIKKPRVQITKVATEDVDVLNIYRSAGADDPELNDLLMQLINRQKMTIICGDLNLCFVIQKNHQVPQMLESIGFTQLVDVATHYKGGHIDHVYSNHDPKKFQVDVMLYSPYYTCKDHDALCVTVRRYDKIKRNRRGYQT